MQQKYRSTKHNSKKTSSQNTALLSHLNLRFSWFMMSWFITIVNWRSTPTDGSQPSWWTTIIMWFARGHCLWKFRKLQIMGLSFAAVLNVIWTRNEIFPWTYVTSICYKLCKDLKLVFAISCLQKLITQTDRQTDRHEQVHNQLPLYGWQLIKNHPHQYVCMYAQHNTS